MPSSLRHTIDNTQRGLEQREGVAWRIALDLFFEDIGAFNADLTLPTHMCIHTTKVFYYDLGMGLKEMHKCG